jgi:hypothetical protein
VAPERATLPGGAQEDEMSEKKAIGHVNCPICGHDHAQIKEDKNGRAYIHCAFACSWQGITRNNYQSDQLKARMRPCTVPTVTVQEPAAPQAPAPVTPAPRPQGTVKAAPVAKKPDAVPPAPTPAKPSFWQPLLGGTNG